MTFHPWAMATMGWLTVSVGNLARADSPLTWAAFVFSSMTFLFCLMCVINAFRREIMR